MLNFIAEPLKYKKKCVFLQAETLKNKIMKKIITIILLTAVSVVSTVAQPTGAVQRTLFDSPYEGGIIKAINTTYAVALVDSSAHQALAIVPIGSTTATFPSVQPIIYMERGVGISDISIVGNDVFMCGTKGDREAWYGYVRLSAAGDNFTTPLQMYCINDMDNAYKLKAYINPNTLAIDIAVICRKAALGSTWGVFHLIRVQNAATPFNYDDAEFDDGYRLFQLAETDDHIVATREDYGTGYCLACFKKNIVNFSVGVYGFTSAEYMHGHVLACTSTFGEDVAIAHFTQAYGPSIVVKIVDVSSMTNTKYYRIDIADKIQPPAMTFIPTNKSLVLLFSETAFPAINIGSTFACMEPYTAPMPTPVLYYRPDEKYYDVATMGQKHFIAASLNQWLLQDETSIISTTIPPGFPCIKDDNVNTSQSAQVTLSPLSTITGSYDSISYDNTVIRTSVLIDRICIY